MNVKHLTILAGGATLLLASVASADFNGLSYDIIGNGELIEGHWTARIYAELGAGDRVDAVYGNAANPMDISSSSSFYQNPFGGGNSTAINPLLYGSFPSLMYDSWITIGLEDQNDNALGSQGIDYGNFEAGGNLYTDDGAIYVTPDESQGQEVGGRVLIAQLTSAGQDSVISFTASLQGSTADGTVWSADASYDFAKPAPGALALLGLAGLAGRRRRRA